MCDRRHPVMILFKTSIGHLSLPTSASIFSVQYRWILHVFFLLSSTEVLFRSTPACFHLLGMENISQPRQKHMQDSPILIGINASRRRLGKMTDRCLKMKHHRIMRIEHFLIDIIQILFRDIEYKIQLMTSAVVKNRLIFFSQHCAVFLTNIGR